MRYQLYLQEYWIKKLRQKLKKNRSYGVYSEENGITLELNHAPQISDDCTGIILTGGKSICCTKKIVI